MSLFKDKILQQSFDDNGFIVIPAFLDRSSVNNILKFIDEKSIRTNINSMYSNLEELDKQAAQNVEDFLCEAYHNGLTHFFKDYRIAGSSFLFKGPGKNSASYLHQDWNIVDETKYQSVVIWVPLEVVTEENGCLVVIPGSHKWRSTIRSSNIDSIHLKYTKQLDQYIVSVPAQPGDAIVYALNTFHGSKPNFTETTRKSAVVSISDISATPIHYFMDEESKKVFTVNGDNNFMYNMYFRLRNGEKVNKSEVEIVEEITDYKDYLMSEKEFYEYLNDKPHLFDKIRNYLGV